MTEETFELHRHQLEDRQAVVRLIPVLGVVASCVIYPHVATAAASLIACAVYLRWYRAAVRELNRFRPSEAADAPATAANE